MKDLEVGDIVTLNESILSAAGVRAYVYEVYDGYETPSQPGACIITEHGEDLGGFSNEEQKQFLTFKKRSSLIYKFTNVMQLQHDWHDGIFHRVFNKPVPNHPWRAPIL